MGVNCDEQCLSELSDFNKRAETMELEKVYDSSIIKNDNEEAKKIVERINQHCIVEQFV